MTFKCIDNRLEALRRKIEADDRLDFNDGCLLYDSPDLIGVGRLADMVRRYAQRGLTAQAVKVDAEGHDYPVLLGLFADLELELFPRIVMFEFQTTPVERSAFEGKLVLLEEPEAGPSDVLVEWPDGGAERDLERQWREIDEILSHSLQRDRPDGR